jgi:hypothetical protein
MKDFSPHAVALGDLVVGVGEEREREVVLLLELHVTLLVVGRDAEDDRARALEVRICVPNPAGLRRTARRVVLGIEVEDDRPAAKIGKADALAGVGGRGEVGCRLALGDHVRRVVGLCRIARRQKQPAASERRPASSGDDRVRDPS